MSDTSTKCRYFINDWYLGQIFSLYTCNYGFIYLQILEKCNRCQKNEKKLGYFPVKIFLPVLENVTDVGKNQGFA
jgi:hypothetical protein